MSSGSNKKSRKTASSAGGGASSANNNNANANNSNSDSESVTSNNPTTRDNADDDEFEPGSWECTVCTFRNKYEAFKCSICDTRKGTSTRKPRLNPTVVQQQTLVQKMAVEVELKQQKKQRTNSEARNSPDLFASPSSAAGTPPITASSSSTTPLPTTPTSTTNSAMGGKFAMATPVNHYTTKSSPSSAQSTTNSPLNSISTKSSFILKRRPIPFHDALVVRSSAKKTVISVDGRNFTIVEFKPRISPRGRKKGSGNAAKGEKEKEREKVAKEKEAGKKLEEKMLLETPTMAPDSNSMSTTTMVSESPIDDKNDNNENAPE